MLSRISSQTKQMDACCLELNTHFPIWAYFAQFREMGFQLRGADLHRFSLVHKESGSPRAVVVASIAIIAVPDAVAPVVAYLKQYR